MFKKNNQRLFTLLIIEFIQQRKTANTDIVNKENNYKTFCFVFDEPFQIETSQNRFSMFAICKFLLEMIYNRNVHFLYVWIRYTFLLGVPLKKHVNINFLSLYFEQSRQLKKILLTNLKLQRLRTDFGRFNMKWLRLCKQKKTIYRIHAKISNNQHMHMLAASSVKFPSLFLFRNLVRLHIPINEYTKQQT